jgi:hypothetical protein
MEQQPPIDPLHNRRQCHGISPVWALGCACACHVEKEIDFCYDDGAGTGVLVAALFSINLSGFRV